MRHTLIAPAVLLAAGLSLAGCADGDVQTETASSTTGAATAGASASATPSTSPEAGASAEAGGGTSTVPEPEAPRTVEPVPEETPVRAITPPYPIDAPADQESGQQPPQVGGIPQQNFTYEQAYAAWQSGMPYYDAFCLHYTPVTDAGISQCYGIEIGTVDPVTGEYIGPR